MSGKRRADNQVTRENLHEFENDNDDASQPQAPSRASADVLSKRKILKPRSRLNRGGDATTGATGNGSASSSGFSFGGASTAGENKPNPYGGLGGFGKPKDDKPAFSFGQPKTDDDKPKTNPFQFLGQKQDAEPEKQIEEKPKQKVFSFLNNNTSDANNALTKASSTELVSTSIKPNKIKALNDNFYDKITEQRNADPVSNFTPILRKYIHYYEKMENDLDYLPDADEESEQSAPKQLGDKEQQKALPAPVFSFGSTSTEPSRSEKEPTPMDESAANTQEVISVDSESEDSSDDEIKVEGPKFTVAKPPTTTDSVFTFDTKPSENKTESKGPVFSFASDASKKFDSPFKLDAPKEEKKDGKEATIGEVKGSTNNFSWTPDKPIKFNDDTKEKGGKPGFSFGETTKPAFSFGQPSEKKNDSKPAFSFGGNTTDKPAFNFGSTEKKEDAPKPSFSFGTATTTATTTTTTEEEKKVTPAFSFGSTSTSTKPAFSFGQQTTTESSEKPNFNFGGSSKPAFSFGGATATTTPATGSSTFNFSFSGSKPAESKEDKPESTGDDDKVQEEEVEGNFKPVVQLTTQIDKKTGEEDEETLYTKRSKLMLFNPANKEQPYESKGLGELKVLQNKETKKARLLVRSDGANRVLLNTAISKDFKYETIGKGDTVRIPTISAEGKIETYIVRVKTPEDGSNFLKSLQSAQ